MDDIIFFKNPQDAMVFKLAYKGWHMLVMVVLYKYKLRIGTQND